MDNTCKAVLFDLDGTLIDTYQLILESFRHATRKVLGRVIPDEQLMVKVGQPLSTQIWDWTDNQEVHDEILTVYREFNHAIHDDTINYFNRYYPPEQVIEKALKDMKKGKSASVLGFPERVQVQLVKHLPTSFVIKTWCKQQGK